MTECTVAVLVPILVGIVLNLVWAAFNVVGMIVGLRGRFIDWYLEGGGFLKIPAFVWGALCLWALIAGLNVCR